MSEKEETGVGISAVSLEFLEVKIHKNSKICKRFLQCPDRCFSAFQEAKL